MAHFAKIGLNSKVIAVHGLDNNKMLNASNVEDETVGVQELTRIHGWPLWVQTSYNTRGNKYYNTDGSEGDQTKKLRGNYAGIGYIWDEENNLFFPPKPYASWVKYNAEARWRSPIGDAPALTTEQASQNTANTHRWSYNWNEGAQSWDIVNLLA
jgi:hypothetical protein